MTYLIYQKMIVLLIFAFISGLITIFAPCIWPLLPIILSATATGGHRKPLGITIGIMVSFAVFTLSISYIVKIIPFDPNILRFFAVFVIGFLGFTLVVPRLSQLLEGYVSRLSGRFAPFAQKGGDGFSTGIVTGVALGLVWAPCAGPILATIATLAATRSVNLQIIAVTAMYVIGVGIPLFAFATLGARLFTKTRALSSYTGRIQQIFGIVMILTAVAIYTNYDKTLQAKLLDAFPSYGNFVVDLESNEAVKKQLQLLKSTDRGSKSIENKPFDMRDMSNGNKNAALSFLGTGAEFTGISKWLNSDPLTLQGLRGKVVLVDFWTYTCINCIRTLPFVTGWYEKYKDQGLVVVGVHTPEFEFEKKTENVENAIDQYNITYPVAQDNDYATWRAYDNHYWPAKYLIDKDGNVRYFHFGEGEYEETEIAIQELLKEAGTAVSQDTIDMPDFTPTGRQTPETYLGSARIDRFVSPESIIGKKQVFTTPVSIPEHSFAFGGEWTVGEEQAIAGKNAQLKLNFYAQQVYLVITQDNGGGSVRVFLDGKQVGTESAGADVKNGVVTLDAARLYHLIDLHGEKDSHTLELFFDTPGTAVYAFTFG